RATARAPRCIELQAVRQLATLPVPMDDLEADHPPAVPAPLDHDAQAYGARLKVPAIDPWQAAGQLHVFHLLRDDLALLHRLLGQWHVDHMGALAALLASDAGVAAAGDEHKHAQLL